jgi:hypothetical protein
LATFLWLVKHHRFKNIEAVRKKLIIPNNITNPMERPLHSQAIYGATAISLRGVFGSIPTEI